MSAIELVQCGKSKFHSKVSFNQFTPLSKSEILPFFECLSRQQESLERILDLGRPAIELTTVLNDMPSLFKSSDDRTYSLNR